jgi:hypothetical protein
MIVTTTSDNRLIVRSESADYLNDFLNPKKIETDLKHITRLIESTQSALDADARKLTPTCSVMDLGECSKNANQLDFLNKIHRNELHKEELVEKYDNLMRGGAVAEEDKPISFWGESVHQICSCLGPTDMENSFFVVLDDHNRADIFCKACRGRVHRHNIFISCLEKFVEKSRNEYENLLKCLDFAIQKEQTRMARND